MTPASRKSMRRGSTRQVHKRLYSGDWLLLIHQLPPHPAYLRVKVRRRLQKLNAIALKNTVYALPVSDDHREDFQWLVREIKADGGEAMLCLGSFIDVGASTVARLSTSRRTAKKARPSIARGTPRGATWVTRRDVFVDRMASAWLIRRFIDPRARFRFVTAERYAPRAGELRFDMYGGEYTHAGDRCTFETLLGAFGLRDRRLQTIAEIVHDIDLKDDKFRHPEVDRVEAMLQNVRRAAKTDAARVERATPLLDNLYEALAKTSGQR